MASRYSNTGAAEAQTQLERLYVQGLQVESRARVEQQHALRAARRRRHAPRGIQPAGPPAEGELALGLAGLAVAGQLERRQQDFLHAALDRADGEALLHDPVGEPLVEVIPGVQQAAGRARPLATLASELDGRRDVVRLEQRPAQ